MPLLPTHTHTIDEDTPACVSSFFPRAPGVVVLLGAGGACVLVSAASDIRGFIADRLDQGTNETPAARGGRADLRPVTRVVWAYRCAIGLETNWVLSCLAEAHDAGLWAELGKRWSTALLCFQDDPPRWQVRESHEGNIGGVMVVGPIPRRGDAAAMGEALDDGFELCRYPAELAKAPCGQACAYKEMGRCPAACDGSEAMSSYLERYRGAMSAVGGGIGAAVASWRAGMERASAAMDFESAAAHKRVLEALSAVPAARVRMARSLAGMRLLVVSPSARAGRAGVWVLGGDGLRAVCSVDERCDEATLGRVWSRAQACPGIGALDARVLLELGLVAREIHAKPGRGRRRVSRVFDLDDPLPTGALAGR